MAKYTIELNNNFDEEESFEVAGDNIAQVSVLDTKGNDITQRSRVKLPLAKMLYLD
jgi:hypothetical protein